MSYRLADTALDVAAAHPGDGLALGAVVRAVELTDPDDYHKDLHSPLLRQRQMCIRDGWAGRRHDAMAVRQIPGSPASPKAR
ncbi:hypothetical protein [Streptomyces specialis]|uniref:hypothetical protein n=1 Tax=Streptomyces specialis TaxID=498367 RepID=UPI00131C3330|nr:hypothetical protein [Streptomyces specialis]